MEIKEILIWYFICGGVTFFAGIFCLVSDLKVGRDIIVDDFLSLLLFLFMWPIAIFVFLGVVFEKIRYITLIKGKDIK